MNDLRTLADRFVADPPVPPPELGTLRRRRSRRRGRAALLGSVVVILAIAAAAIAMAGDDGEQKVVTGSTTSTTSIVPPPVVPPPPLSPVDVEIVSDPAVVRPEGDDVSLTYRNRTGRPVPINCSFVRIDRWTGSVWSPMGRGYSGEYGTSPPAPECHPIRSSPGADGTLVDVPIGPLEPGWYRWVDDIDRDQSTEGRFTVAGPDEPPEGDPGRTTIWLSLGDTLANLRPLPYAALGPPDVGVNAFTLAGRRLVITWKTQCNVPLAAVTLTVEDGHLVVLPLFASFGVIDCDGDPDAPGVGVIDIPPHLRRPHVDLADLANGSVRPVRDRVPVARETVANGAAGATVPVAVRPVRGVADGRLELAWYGSPCDGDAVRAEVVLLRDVAIPVIRVPDACAPAAFPYLASGSWGLGDAASRLRFINQP